MPARILPGSHVWNIRPRVRLIRTMCAGRVHPKLVQYAFAKGAGLVLVTGCHPPGDCHYLSGNLRAKASMEKLKPKLAAQGIDPERLQLAWISATEGRAFQQLILEMTRKLAELKCRRIQCPSPDDGSRDGPFKPWKPINPGTGNRKLTHGGKKKLLLCNCPDLKVDLADVVAELAARQVESVVLEPCCTPGGSGQTTGDL